MFRITSFFSVLILSVITLFSQPKIEITGGDTKDWGKVSPKDSPLKTDIVIKNIGSELLKITKMKPGCGCTTAPLKKDSLAPGESTVVEVSLNISGNTGGVTKSISIETNDPAKTSINYLLRAEVIRPISVLPRTYMSFEKLQVGKTGESKVIIKNTSNEVIILSDVRTSPEELKINLVNKKELKPGEEFELVGKITPTKAGSINTNVTIKTSHPDSPELSISGFGKVDDSPIFNNK
jgi:hypothetical protein